LAHNYMFPHRPQKQPLGRVLATLCRWKPKGAIGYREVQRPDHRCRHRFHVRFPDCDGHIPKAPFTRESFLGLPGLHAPLIGFPPIHGRARAFNWAQSLFLPAAKIPMAVMPRRRVIDCAILAVSQMFPPWFKTLLVEGNKGPPAITRPRGVSDHFRCGDSRKRFGPALGSNPPSFVICPLRRGAWPLGN